MTSNVILPPFDVTQRAVETIAALGGRVRLGIDDGGCCGQAWSFSLEGSSDDTWVRFGCEGAWLDVDGNALGPGLRSAPRVAAANRVVAEVT